MVRTQIQLEEDQSQQLRRLGVRSGKGLAAQVREAVGRHLAQRGAGVEPLDTALGKFRPRPATDLKPHDRAYADTLR